jgi:hypothetical protein
MEQISQVMTDMVQSQSGLKGTTKQTDEVGSKFKDTMEQAKVGTETTKIDSEKLEENPKLALWLQKMQEQMVVVQIPQEELPEDALLKMEGEEEKLPDFLFGEEEEEEEEGFMEALFPSDALLVGMIQPEETNWVFEGNVLPTKEREVEELVENVTENDGKIPVEMQENRSENVVKTQGNSSEENDSMNKVDSNYHMNRMNQKQDTDGTALVGVNTMREIQTEEGTLQVSEGAKSATKTEQIELPMVKEQIVKSVSEGNSEFEIQLKPEHLGTLTIRASYENNKAVVSVICSEVKSLIAVLQSSDDLAKLLQEKLGAPTQVVVELPQEDYVQQEHTQRENQSRQQEESAQQEKNEQEEAGVFLQQLRLGLIS